MSDDARGAPDLALRRLTLLWLLLLSAPAIAGEPDYRIDPASSQATFQVRLFWLDHVNGDFTQVSGEVDPGPLPDSWVVDATIPVDDVSMPSTRMRQWVLAPAFFDAEHHPLIHFVSNPFTQEELDGGGTLTGYLTLRGVTAPIRFSVQPAHCVPLAPTPCRIVLNGRLQRSTFGMNSDRVALSDRVDLSLSITLQRENR
jgi:polyisoprenoid-binding protein YceI